MAAAAAGPAFGQALDHRFWIEASGYRPSIDTQASVSRPGAPGTELDLETDLELNKHETLPALYGGARWGRWVVAGEYYALDRNGTRTLSRDIVFDGTTYALSSVVESKLSSDIYRVTLGYAFLRGPQYEAGAAIGLHATDFGISLDGEPVGGGAGRESRRRNFLAPMPTLGVFGTYQPTPKIVLTARADYLSMKIDDFDGSILNVQAAASYRVTDNIEVGVAYRHVDYGLHVEKDSYTAAVDYDFNGPALFLRAGFR
jgi:hypothetical protein